MNHTKKTNKKGGGVSKKITKPNNKSAAPIIPSGITHVKKEKIILGPNGIPLTESELRLYNQLQSLEAERASSNVSNNENDANESTANSRRAVLELAAINREQQQAKLDKMGETLRREARENIARARADAIARQERQRQREAEAKASTPLNNCAKKPGGCTTMGGGKNSTKRRKRRHTMNKM